jgi:GT2 family glycosyltransferase
MATAVLDIDFDRLPELVSDLERYDSALAVLRLDGRVAGQAYLPVFGDRLTREQLHEELLHNADSAFWEAWLQRWLGLWDADPAPRGFPVTVAVCTRDRTDDLRRCLDALTTLPDDGQEILVVDNAPRTDDTLRLVGGYAGVRYVREERPGLDNARNRALAEARHEIVVFTDDDAVADREWLRLLLRNFTDERIGCVTGLAMPLEMETDAQVTFQRLGGLGRGLKRFTLDGSTADPQVGWMAGAGVITALRREVVEEVGPFDPALDVGTPTAGGGDSDMFRRLLAAGYRIVYDPQALVWHRHRRTNAELRRQYYGYDSAGFAIWSRALFREGEFGALEHAWQWLWRELRYLVGAVRTRRGREFLPFVLARLRGAVAGPWTYLYTSLRERRPSASLPAMPALGPASRGQCFPVHLESLATTAATAGEHLPLVSVVIPTHNRAGSLRRLLDALCRQTYPAARTEVVVVSDGSTDATAELVRGFHAPFALHLLERRCRGAGIARNHGAALATGEILLFLDDDVEPAPGLIAAHAEAQAHLVRRVVVGPYPPARVRRPDLYQLNSRWWWDTRFREAARPHHRFGYRDVVTGNLSLRRSFFDEVGGFDPVFRDAGGEDWEFGIRLLAAGAELTFAPAAFANHHDSQTTDLARALRRAELEGVADVLMCRRHAGLAPWLPLRRLRGSLAKMRARRLWFALMRGGTPLATLLLRLLQTLKLRRQWRSAYSAIRSARYFHGAFRAAGGARGLAALQRAKPALPADGERLHIDLAEGLHAAERRIDREQPHALLLHFGAHPIGVVDPLPFAEPLRGRHLRGILADRLEGELLEALALDGALAPAAEDAKLALVQRLRGLRRWSGGPLQTGMWFEQYHQWKRLQSRLRACRLSPVPPESVFEEVGREVIRLQIEQNQLKWKLGVPAHAGAEPLAVGGLA